MNTLKLKVTSNKLEAENEIFTTSGSIDFDECTFTFDSTWDGFAKTAVFGFGDSDFIRVDIVSDTCNIPSICLQNEGILRIGVFGINADDVVITTNCIAHRVEEGVGEIESWFEEDRTLVYNALKEIEQSLEEYKQELDTSFDALLEEFKNDLTVEKTSWGEPADWYIPTEYTDYANAPDLDNDSTYRDFLKYRIEPLKVDYPEYVDIKYLCFDSSKLNSVYYYIFEPANYEKTVYITSCIHGEDSSPVLALSHFLDDLCRNYTANRTLNYIRSKVKLVVVAIANPYGFVNKTRLNYNGVDLQRNFPYKWDECTSAYKGAAASDQTETCNLLRLAEIISTDKLCAVLDISAGANCNRGKIAFYPKFKSNCLSAVSDTLNSFNYDMEDETMHKTVFAASMNPTITNCLSDLYGINACSLCWSTSDYASLSRDKEITKFAELIGNMLFTLAKNSSFATEAEALPLIKNISWRSSSNNDVFGIQSSSDYNKFPLSTYSMILNKPCCITVNGYVLLDVIQECSVSLIPVLWQENSSELSYAERLTMTDSAVTLTLSQGNHSIPINSVIQAFRSDSDSIYPGRVMFTIASKADEDSSANIIGFNVTLNAFESDAGKPVEIYCPMGNVADYTDSDDIPTQQVIYPTEKVAETDTEYYD